MHQLITTVKHLIYPRCCPLCHQILRDQRALLCPACARALHPISEPRCKRCGCPVEEEQEVCPDCAPGRRFREGRGIFLYDEQLRHSILLYKFGGRREYGRFFAKALCVYGQKEILRWKPDLILPVPMHPRKQRQRGFNQAEDLAVRVGSSYGIPVACDRIKKVHATREQKRLDAAARKQNLQKAFRLQGPVPGRRILLVDDVFTTGSTIDTLAGLLKAGGASEVFFLTVAIGGKKDFS